MMCRLIVVLISALVWAVVVPMLVCLAILAGPHFLFVLNMIGEGLAAMFAWGIETFGPVVWLSALVGAMIGGSSAWDNYRAPPTGRSDDTGLGG